ncbi:MAG: NlpC/P60 family protein [Chitinophagales bacterium]
MLKWTGLKNKIALCLAVFMLLTVAGASLSTAALANSYGTLASYTHYNQHEKPLVASLRASFNGSLAQRIVGRAIWYMEYGYIYYGHTRYATTGYCDCSQYVSMVYRDFGYSITSASRNYTTVGTRVSGVYSQRIPGTSRYTLVGVSKLKPGDIFTFWKIDASGNKYIGHVALYMGLVDGKPRIINTCGGHPTAIGIVDGFGYWYGSNLYQVRRVLPSTAYVPGGMKITDRGPVIPAIYRIKPTAPIIMPKNLPTGF